MCLEMAGVGGWGNSRGDQDLFCVLACKFMWLEMNGKESMKNC